ncbi:hypothetical protein PIB30_064694 [Stylosanthes scabra]|uniref:Ubiquitin-like protease family profile domain-containing protein n=1 Tax=Stylosanthes scabra TaxID=79078 RepID=A0ABU6YPE2_9FABA|nr:hypothetical protein [Stylosanthes scabra]
MASSKDNEAWKKGGRPRNPDGPKLKSLDSRCSPSGLNKIMTQLQQDDLKVAEIITMGFGDFQQNPDWIVQQELFLHIASKFDLNNNLIKDDVGNIEVNAAVIERATGLPSYGADFQEYEPDDIHTAALKLRWGSVILFHRLEWGQLDKYRGLEPWFAQWTTSMLDLRAASILKKAEEEASKYYAKKKKQDISDRPSFSLGFTPEFNTPTPSPDALNSEDTEEVLDIAPIRKLLPVQDPASIQSLTLEQDNKIYNWVMNPSKAKGIQEETIASFRGHQNFFISRSEIRFLKPKGWIDDKNTATTDKNLDAYQKDGTYIGMHPKLGEDGRHFDWKKAANRKWLVMNSAYALFCEFWHDDELVFASNELLVLDSMYDHPIDDLRKSLDIYVGKLIEDMLKIMFPTFDQKGLGFPSRYTNVPKQLNTNDCSIYVIKFLEEWREASELHAYNNEELLKIRRRLVLDIALSNYNTNRDELLLKASTITQR